MGVYPFGQLLNPNASPGLQYNKFTLHGIYIWKIIATLMRWCERAYNQPGAPMDVHAPLTGSLTKEEDGRKSLFEMTTTVTNQEFAMNETMSILRYISRVTTITQLATLSYEYHGRISCFSLIVLWRLKAAMVFRIDGWSIYGNGHD